MIRAVWRHSTTRNLLKVRDLTLTIVTNRPLHAVLVERAGPRLLELLAAALDGSGPAIAPVDAALPPARLAELLAALGPATVEDADGVITPFRSARNEGVAEGTAVIVATSGSTGEPKGVELSAAALLHSARASLARVGARPGERWLCCLPATHIAGMQVLVRSLVSGTDPVLAERADAQTRGRLRLRARVAGADPAAAAAGRTAGRSLAGFSSVLLGGAAAPAGLLGRRPGGAGAGGDDLRHDRDLRRLRVRRGAAGRGAGADRGRRAHLVGGPVLFSGYRGGPAGAWPSHGSGPADLGLAGSVGRLVVRGRADDVINTGGHKVVPGEVAAALQSLPGRRGRGGRGRARRRMGRTGRRGGGAGRPGRPAGC